MEKQIDGLDYFITDDGKVISYKQGKRKVLKTWYQKEGYENIKLLLPDGTRKHFLIHRLVATAYIPNPDNLPEVNHKNKDKTKNIVENLEWCSRKENLYDSYSTLGPKRNYYNCELIGPNGLIDTFDSILLAAKFAERQFGCSFSYIRKTGAKSKGYYIRKIEGVTTN